MTTLNTEKLTRSIELVNDLPNRATEVYIRREDRRDYTARIDLLRVTFSPKPYGHAGILSAQVAVWGAPGWRHLVTLSGDALAEVTSDQSDGMAVNVVDWVGHLLS